MKIETSPDSPEPDEIRAEYDFRDLRDVVRGKHADRYQEQLRLVRLEPDIATAFHDEAAVNAALRDYLRTHSGGAQ
jgi:hypothetical protein